VYPAMATCSKWRRSTLAANAASVALVVDVSPVLLLAKYTRSSSGAGDFFGGAGGVVVVVVVVDVAAYATTAVEDAEPLVATTDTPKVSVPLNPENEQLVVDVVTTEDVGLFVPSRSVHV
jgi:hypothetical protein